MAPLLPHGESVEGLLRTAQFFTLGTPSGDYREVHRSGGRGAEDSDGSGGATTKLCARRTA